MLQAPDGRVINTVAAIVDGYSRERYLDSAPWIIEALTKLGLGVEVFRLTDSRMPMRLLGFSPDVVWPMSLGGVCGRWQAARLPRDVAARHALCRVGCGRVCHRDG